MITFTDVHATHFTPKPVYLFSCINLWKLPRTLNQNAINFQPNEVIKHRRLPLDVHAMNYEDIAVSCTHQSPPDPIGSMIKKK